MLEVLGKMSLTIPGMITPEAGKFLYSLCYMQDLEGDVVEIGSWQGRSSTFLARAVKESGNGNFYAIDHFGGNAGKEEFYAINGSLSSLKDNFNDNLSRFGLIDTVNLLDMVNTEACEKIKGRKIRFLFIDGDHTKDGVKKDIELFFPQLEKGSIVVFDDYFEGFSGLIEAVDEILEKYNFDKVFYHRHTLVIKL
jgi:predicted O-methyltransferase YrrM